MQKSRSHQVARVFGALFLVAGICLLAVFVLHRPSQSESFSSVLAAMRLKSLSLMSQLSTEADSCENSGVGGGAADCFQRLIPERALVIDTARNELMMIQGNSELHRFPVGSASIRQGFDSPHGVFRVEKIEPCPPYYALNPAKPIPGCDPRNPLGTAALWFLGRNYGVHGTSRPELIDERVTTAESRRVSRGCFRLNNGHMKKILPLVQTGTPVWVRLGQNSPAGGGQVIVSSQLGLPTVALVRFNPGVVSVVIEHRQSGQKFRVFAPQDTKRDATRDRTVDSGMGVFAAYRLPLQINEANSAFRTSFQFERDLASKNLASKRLAFRERD